ncbi:hypothetical protein TSUD_99890 [Trifolium subterraneum]|uniref:Uncharacterized protein n=1 Tax=Trifolium subterraneum TaxID=3900 RepID=A0A2Z6PR53_TRISU|nr:hypothetical protein TSUD_99890 [Trifolium subterraneum]
MVLLRELDGAKDYPLVIYPVGSDWERQVRAHYTRADGTLNIDGYYSEIFVFTVKSSNFESGTSDIDSSGNDSDCVIISSSEFRSTNPNNRSLIVADSVATISTSMEISSRFTTDEFVSTFRQAVRVSGEGGENRVVIDPIALGEFVTTVNEQEPHYFYMYTHVLQTLHLGLSFNSFECQILRVMNIAPCQLHPNSWTFLKAFQVACEALSKFQVLSYVELISREDKPQSLGEYMERAAASTDAMSQLVVEESGVKNTKRKNSEGSGRIPVEVPKEMKVTVVDEEEAEVDDEPLKFRRTSKGFQKYARTSHLSELTFEDLRQAAMDHHIQGALLTYYLSNRQELESIDFRNKIESADNGLSALEKEFAAAKSKFDEDLAAVKAEQEQKMKVNDDEVTALKGKVKALEGELKVATQGKEEASQKVDVLAAKVDALEMDVASQYDDGFRFALDQVKVAFPDVDVVKLGELDSVNQIVDGKIVAYVPPASE